MRVGPRPWTKRIHSTLTAVSRMDLTTATLEKQLREAAAESRLQSNELRKKAARLKEEATEVEKQAKRLCVQASDCCRLCDTLEFDALCLALQRNDADTTVVPRRYSYPIGYSQRLGEALQGNTQVSELTIDLSKLTPAFFEACKLENIIDPLIQYIQTSESIRKVVLCSDRSDIAVNELKIAFLNAVFENGKRIKELDCYVIVPGFVFYNGMPSATLQKLDIEFGHSSERERVAIASAFSSSSSLEKL